MCKRGNVRRFRLKSDTRSQGWLSRTVLTRRSLAAGRCVFATLDSSNKFPIKSHLVLHHILR